jgi:type IV pilus assembly protein PilB
MAVRLGELLLREKRISPHQLQEALTHQRTSGGRLGFNLVRLGFVKDEDITAVLSRQYGVPAITLDQFELDAEVVRLVPGDTALKYLVLAVGRSGNTLTLAMSDPTNVFAMDDIKFMTGLQIEPVVASESAVREAIGRYYGGRRHGAPRYRAPRRQAKLARSGLAAFDRAAAQHRMARQP